VRLVQSVAEQLVAGLIADARRICMCVRVPVFVCTRVNIVRRSAALFRRIIASSARFHLHLV
jgi:hypothetical protein